MISTFFFLDECCRSNPEIKQFIWSKFKWPRESHLLLHWGGLRYRYVRSKVYLLPISCAFVIAGLPIVPEARRNWMYI